MSQYPAGLGERTGGGDEGPLGSSMPRIQIPHPHQSPAPGQQKGQGRKGVEKEQEHQLWQLRVICSQLSKRGHWQRWPSLLTCYQLPFPDPQPSLARL